MLRMMHVKDKECKELFLTKIAQEGIIPHASCACECQDNSYTFSFLHARIFDSNGDILHVITNDIKI